MPGGLSAHLAHLGHSGSLSLLLPKPSFHYSAVFMSVTFFIINLIEEKSLLKFQWTVLVLPTLWALLTIMSA